MKIKGISKTNTEQMLAELADKASKLPDQYSDKVYDIATIEEGIYEVLQVGVRSGIEQAMLVIESYCDAENTKHRRIQR